MTDKKTDTSQDDRARSKSPVLTTPASKRVPPPGSSDADSVKSKPGSRSVLAPAALVLALLAVGLSGALWQQHRQAQESQARLSAQLAGNESATDRSSAQIQDVLERVRRQEARIESMQAQLGESAAIIQDLDEALRSMTDRGSELVLLNDVDHLATIAQQQLQLGGNVRNAIVALESAQAQLARANRPALASLLQTLNGDLDRLRAASTIDIAVFSRQLEELAVLLTEAPLIMPDDTGAQGERRGESIAREHPAPTVPPAAAQGGSWWEQAWDTTREWSRDAWGSLREDLGQFIEVRRVDDASALLMSPDQASRFRDNLRTRVMTAQLALMMRQPEVWKTETEAVVKAIESRYDQSSSLTRKALRLARNMADSSIDASLPTVDNTLQALAALREEQARSFGGAESPVEDTPGQSDVQPMEEPAEEAGEAGGPGADAEDGEGATNGSSGEEAAGAESEGKPAVEAARAPEQAES